jgi:hypothetical protein
MCLSPGKSFSFKPLPKILSEISISNWTEEVSAFLGNYFKATFSPVEMCFPNHTTAAPPFPSKFIFLYPDGSLSP